MDDMNNIKIANEVLKQELAGLSRVQKSFDKEFEKVRGYSKKLRHPKHE